MNQDSNTSSAFSDNTNATQTNPFTGDLKGEFTSDFGTSTNVSQMFNGDGGGGDKKRLIFIIGGALVAILLLGLLLMEDEQDGFDDFADQAVEQQGEFADQSGLEDEPPASDPLAEDSDPLSEGDPLTAEDPLATPEGESADPLGEIDTGVETSEASATGQDPVPEPMGSSLASTGSITVGSPFDGANLSYDETQGPATFTWNGAADRIVFSRSSSMASIDRSVNVAGRQSYRFLHPHPGTWFWRLENAEGGTPVQSFTINAPIRRNFPITAPAPGGQIAGTGGVVSWQGDTKVARYKVELVASGSSWATVSYQFGTSGTSVALQNVPAGQYDIRVGAFSEVAGRWEYQVISGVTVQ